MGIPISGKNLHTNRWKVPFLLALIKAVLREGAPMTSFYQAVERADRETRGAPCEKNKKGDGATLSSPLQSRAEL